MHVDSKPSTKKPDIDTDVPVTKNIPETKTPDLIKVDSDLPEGNIKKMDGESHKSQTTQNKTNEKDVLEFKEGKKGEGWNNELNKELKPNAKYKVDDYLYETDLEGRIKKVSGELKLDARGRNAYQQGKSVTSKGGTKGADQGGHLIGDRFFGPGEQINYLPMDAKLNQGAWKAMENKWATELAAGKKVEVDIRPVFEGTLKRPTKFIVKEIIDGKVKIHRFNN